MTSKNIFPNDKVIVTKLFDIHQDWEVPIPGFFSIATVRKIKSVAEFTDEEAQEFSKLLCKMRKGMKEVLGINVVYLIQNEDTTGDFHLWMFSRHKWMERFGIKIESVRPIINYAKENMVNDKVIAEVKEYVKKMKEYMKDF